MSARGDAGAGTAGSPSYPGGNGNYVPKNKYWTYTSVKDNLYVHHGVPAWKTAGDDLCFKDKTPFFTYDPTINGINDYEFPFVQSKKGVLCNWFSGSESLSAVMWRLLHGEIFYGFPWTPAISYMFRGPEIPKLIFVFTNEYDNELCRTKTDLKKSHSVVAVPTINGTSVGFDAASVDVVDSMSGVRVNQLTPYDPLCLSYIPETNPEETIDEFLKEIGIADDQGAASGITALRNLDFRLTSKMQISDKKPADDQLSVRWRNVYWDYEKFGLVANKLNGVSECT